MCWSAHTEDNTLLRSLWARVDIERATVGMYHRGSSRYARVIYEMKYARRPALALATLRSIVATPAFRNFSADVDAVVPVPTTWWRRLVRGYNPAALIADEIGRTCRRPAFPGALKRKRGARQSRTAGALRTDLSRFSFTFSRLPVREGAHVLLVDDVATTGTTLTACALALRRARPDLRISVFALAWAGK